MFVQFRLQRRGWHQPCVRLSGLLWDRWVWYTTSDLDKKNDIHRLPKGPESSLGSVPSLVENFKFPSLDLLRLISKELWEREKKLWWEGKKDLIHLRWWGPKGMRLLSQAMHAHNWGWGAKRERADWVLLTKYQAYPV